MKPLAVVLALLTGVTSFGGPASAKPDRQPMVVMFIVDGSDAVTGASLTATKEAVLAGRAELFPEDTVAIHAFIKGSGQGTHGLATERRVAAHVEALKTAGNPGTGGLASAVIYARKLTPARMHVVFISNAGTALEHPTVVDWLKAHEVTVSTFNLGGADQKDLDAAAGQLAGTSYRMALDQLAKTVADDVRRVVH